MRGWEKVASMVKAERSLEIRDCDFMGAQRLDCVRCPVANAFYREVGVKGYVDYDCIVFCHLGVACHVPIEDFVGQAIEDWDDGVSDSFPHSIFFGAPRIGIPDDLDWDEVLHWRREWKGVHAYPSSSVKNLPTLKNLCKQAEIAWKGKLP